MKHSFTHLLFALCLCASASAQQSLNMSLLGHWDDANLPVKSGVTFNDIWGYAVQGREYAIVGSLLYVHFFNITNPATPVEVGRFPGGANSIWRDMKTYRHYAYAVADQGTEGLMVFDLSGLDSPTPSVAKVAQLTNHFTRAHNIFIDTDAGRLYVVGSPTGHILVFNLDSQNGGSETAPVLMANVALNGGYVHDVYVVNDTAFCSHVYESTLRIYDMNTPTTPVECGIIDSYPERGYNHSSWRTADGKHLVFADENHGLGLKIADLSDLSNIIVTPQNVFRSQLLAPTHTNSIAHNPFILGNLVFVSYYHDGVQVFDISDPQNVQRVAYYDTYPESTSYAGYQGAWGVYPYLPSGNVIASDVLNGLFVLRLEASLLPVAWGGFTAKAAQEGIHLQWHTLTEVGTDRFEVEHSTDGRTFHALAQVSAAGHSEMARHYAHTHRTPVPGTNYYRLRQRDTDGQSSYSTVVAAEWLRPVFRLHPSPVAPGQRIYLTLPHAAQPLDALLLYDVLGRLCHTWPLPPSHTHAEVVMPDLPHGLYYAVLRGQEGHVAPLWVGR